MKKIQFYSLVRYNGEIKAMLQNGYTDGEFYYYKSPYHSRKWYVIDPECGIAIWSDKSMKICAAVAHDETIREKVKHEKSNGRGERWANEFAEYIEIAKQADFPKFLENVEK